MENDWSNPIQQDKKKGFVTKIQGMGEFESIEISRTSEMYKQKNERKNAMFNEWNWMAAVNKPNKTTKYGGRRVLLSYQLDALLLAWH